MCQGPLFLAACIKQPMMIQIIRCPRTPGPLDFFLSGKKTLVLVSTSMYHEKRTTQTEGKHFNFMQFMALTLLPLIHHSQERIRVERAFKPHSACSFRSRDVKSFGNTFFLWQKSKEGTRTFFAQQAVKENDFDGCCYGLLSFILVVST